LSTGGTGPIPARPGGGAPPKQEIAGVIPSAMPRDSAQLSGKPWGPADGTDRDVDADTFAVPLQ
jgi:hypothetical protein